MKTRTQKLPPLHPSTIAALVGHYRIVIAADGTTSGTVTAPDLSATYQAAGVSCELVGLVIAIREASKDDREHRQALIDDLARVAGIAVAVDDAGFPEQLGFAMSYARNPATPRRRAVFQAWQHLTSGCTVHNHLTGQTRKLSNPSKKELHEMAEEFFGEAITPRTLDDDLAEMHLSGFVKRPRGAPKKAG